MLQGVLFGALKNRQVCRYFVMGEIRDFPIVFFPLYFLVLVKNLRAAIRLQNSFINKSEVPDVRGASWLEALATCAQAPMETLVLCLGQVHGDHVNVMFSQDSLALSQAIWACECFFLIAYNIKIASKLRENTVLSLWHILLTIQVFSESDYQSQSTALFQRS